MKEWAQREGVHPVTAYRWSRAAKLPVPAGRVGRLILVEPPASAPARSVATGWPLDPSPRQVRALLSHCGAARVAYNWGPALAALAGESDVAGSGPETENGRGTDHKTSHARLVAVKRQPGTATAGQAGTAAPQGAAVGQDVAHAD